MVQVDLPVLSHYPFLADEYCRVVEPVRVAFEEAGHEEEVAPLCDGRDSLDCAAIQALGHALGLCPAREYGSGRDQFREDQQVALDGGCLLGYLRDSSNVLVYRQP